MLTRPFVLAATGMRLGDLLIAFGNKTGRVAYGMDDGDMTTDMAPVGRR